MRAVLYALSFLAVMGLAFWAYRENYATQKSMRHVEDLQTEIGTLREALTVQRAEWAYLNRPDRLRDLATINFDRLGLLPMEPMQFGYTNQIAYPAPPELRITGTIETMGSLNPADVVNADPEEQTP